MKGLLFTFGLCYGGAVVALWRPFYGLLIYICFAIIKPEATWFWSVPAGNYSRIIAIALLLGWAINGFGGFQFGKSKWVIGPLVAFFLWSCFSGIVSPDPDLAMVFIEGQFKIILPVVVGATLIKTRKQLMQLAWTIVLSMGYLAFELNQYYFDGNNILLRQGFTGMDNNSFAIALVSAVGMAFFLGLGSQRLSAKLLSLAVSALMAHAVFFSFSRGGMLALCVVGICTFWFLPKRPVYLTVFAAGCAVGFMMAGQEVVERFTMTFAEGEQRDESAESRLIMWKACLTIMSENPVAGIGPDRFTQVVHLYTPYNQGKEAHTLWLTIGAEIGVPGMIFLLGYYFVTGGMLYRFLRRNKRTRFQDPFDRFVPQMVITSLAGFMVAAQFVSLERLELPYYVALLGAGAIKVYSQQAQPARNRSKVRWVPANQSLPTSETVSA